MESSFRIARVGGIEIGASWSWLIVVALVVWSLAAGFFPATYPGLGGGTHLVMAVVTALLFFASVLLHELGHARQALREGVPMEGITLWLFGGVAKMRGSPPSAGAAFRVSALGPAVSALLAVGFGLVAWLGSQLDAHEAVQGVVDYLARINALVLAFNLVPALPLDGGRILQAWVWHRTGRYTRSTVQAATAGKAFGYMLIAVGLLGLFGGTGLGSIWLAFIGWFLVQAAGAEASHAMLRGALGMTRVRDAMSPAPSTVTPDMPVGEFLAGARHSSYPVTDGDDLVGLATLRAAGDVPPAERPRRRVRDVMTPRDRLPVTDAGTELAGLLEAGTFSSERSRLPVLDHGRLVGVLAPSDVALAIELGEARGGEATGPASAGTAPGETAGAVPVNGGDRDRGVGGPGTDDRRAGEPGAGGRGRTAPETKGRREARDGERSAGLLVWVVVGLVIVAAAGFLYRPPLVVLAPGETVAVEEGVTVDGAPVTEVDGSYLLTSVHVGQTHALGTLVAWLRTDREVVPVDEVIPPDIDAEEYFEQQQEVFDESRRLAAAAAARATGHEVTVDGNGAEIVAVVPEAAAADELDAGDVIVAVGGTPVETSEDLRQATRGHRAGTALTLTVQQAGSDRTDEVVVQTSSLPDLDGEAGLGAFVVTRDLDVDLPFEVSFPERDIGGPSAGLAYALAITDILAPEDLAEGRTIAATGTIGIDGSVGPIGGARLKAVAADEAGADLFLVPPPDADAARDQDDIEVRSARTLRQARDRLLPS